MKKQMKKMLMPVLVVSSVMMLAACGDMANNEGTVAEETSGEENVQNSATGENSEMPTDSTMESVDEQAAASDEATTESAEPVKEPEPYVDKLDRSDEGFTLVWNDEFDGEALDTTKWDYQYGNGGEYGNPGWGNSEVQYYLNREENVRVEDGKLIITALKEDTAMPYTSARIRTITNRGEVLFATTYGRVEARIKLPEGEGIWPAFWMLPVDQNIYGAWAASGEIDIMEAKGRLTEQIGGAAHFGKVWPNNTYTNKDYFFEDGTDITDYHLYSIEWEPGEIRWYVDNECYFTLNDWFSQGSVQGTTYAEPAPFDVPFYIILNMAVGGTFDPEANLDNAEFPVEMEVDFVRVYHKEEGYDTSAIREAVETIPEKKISYSSNGIYNGAFDQGNNRLAYWELEGMEAVVPDFVVNEDGTNDYSRMAELAASAENGTLSQAGIPLSGGNEYLVGMEVAGDEAATIDVALVGSDGTVYMEETYNYAGGGTEEIAEYGFAVPEGVEDADARFILTLQNGESIKVDNIRVTIR